MTSLADQDCLRAMRSPPMPRDDSVFRTRLRRAFLSALVLLLGYAAPLVAAEQPLVLAIHPYLPVPEIHSRFGPFADYLARELGRPVTIRVGGNYEQHNQAIGKNQVDMAFLGPVPCILVSRQSGSKPLLARLEVNGQSSLYGVIAVRKESKLTSLIDLKNASMAFGDPESTMSHIVPRHMLLKAGIPGGAPARHKFLGAHKSVALAVLAGDYDAGAMKKEVFDEMAPRGLRALATTPGVPDHVFVTRADLPKATIERLRQVMLHLKDQPGGMAILGKIQSGLTGLGPVNDADFATLRVIVREVDDATR